MTPITTAATETRRDSVPRPSTCWEQALRRYDETKDAKVFLGVHLPTLWDVTATLIYDKRTREGDGLMEEKLRNQQTLQRLVNLIRARSIFQARMIPAWDILTAAGYRALAHQGPLNDIDFQIYCLAKQTIGTREDWVDLLQRLETASFAIKAPIVLAISQLEQPVVHYPEELNGTLEAALRRAA